MERIRRLLAWSLVLVAAAGLLVEIWHSLSHDPVVEVLLPFFSLSHEQNLPTWYSSCLLFSCALALGAIAAHVSETGGEWRRSWWALATIFAYLSLDEAAEIHEHLHGLVHFEGVGSGLFYFSWVVPGAAVVAVFGVTYLRFLFALPPTTRNRFIVSGVIYVGGALLMELPLGLWANSHGTENLGYALIDHVEETLEMVGASLFLLSLLAHLQRLRKGDGGA
jgi:hypothetical protein